VTTILNPAPVRPLPEGLLFLTDVLTPNEVEAGLLTGTFVKMYAMQWQQHPKLLRHRREARDRYPGREGLSVGDTRGGAIPFLHAASTLLIQLRQATPSMEPSRARSLMAGQWTRPFGSPTQPAHSRSRAEAPKVRSLHEKKLSSYCAFRAKNNRRAP